MTDVRPITGWCYICDDSYQGDAEKHFADSHPVAATKIRVAKISWQMRLDNVIQAITEIRAEADHAVKVNRLDTEVIQELYLVRAKLAQMRRDKEGVKNGSD